MQMQQQAQQHEHSSMRSAGTSETIEQGLGFTCCKTYKCIGPNSLKRWDASSSLGAP